MKRNRWRGAEGEEQMERSGESLQCACIYKKTVYNINVKYYHNLTKKEIKKQREGVVRPQREKKRNAAEGGSGGGRCSSAAEREKEECGREKRRRRKVEFGRR